MEAMEEKKKMNPEVHSFLREILRSARNSTRNNFLRTGHPCTVQFLSSTSSEPYINHLRLGVPVWQGTCNCGFRSHKSSPRRLL